MDGSFRSFQGGILKIGLRESKGYKRRTVLIHPCQQSKKTSLFPEWVQMTPNKQMPTGECDPRSCSTIWRLCCSQLLTCLRAVKCFHVQLSMSNNCKNTFSQWTWKWRAEHFKNPNLLTVIAKMCSEKSAPPTALRPNDLVKFGAGRILWPCAGRGRQRTVGGRVPN